MNGLQGKVVIVAGAASGIGAATARTLARYGCKVVLGDLPGAGAASTAALIDETGGAALHCDFDIVDEKSIADLFAFTLDSFGRLDGLHNNVAAVSLSVRDTNLLDIELDVWERTLRVNLTGLFLTMRHAVRQMLKQGGGAIVNTSSSAAFTGEERIPAYASSKAALLALTRHVSSAYGRQGIRCNAVAPSGIATEGAVAASKAMGADAEAYFRERRAHGPHSHRAGRSEDIAEVVALLLSEGGSWINGQCINVDGGRVYR